jgi:hypothetical protein
MSTLKNKNITNLQRVSTFVFLALIFFSSSVNQFVHVHHFHQDDSLELEISYHPIDIALEHASVHNHSEENSSPTNDNQHKYKNQVDWNNSRLQSTTNITFDDQELFFSIVYLPPVGIERSISFYKEPPFTKEHYSSLSTIRGPPLFG